MKVNMKKLNTKKFLPGLLAAVVIIGGYLFYINFVSTDTITVTGSATHEITNQIASFTITVEVNDEDKAVAVEDVEEQVNEIIDAIKDFGIPEKDLQTQHLNIYQRDEPFVEDGRTTYEPGDWYASYSVEITLRDLDKSSSLTALLAGFDNSTMWGPNLRVDPDEINEEDILNDAVEDARQKAGALATASGKRIGKIVNIVEGGGGGYPIGLVREGGMGGAGLPIEPGSSSITKTVTVTFRLK
ncbi:SIMPL domain-containing protein [Patescibacteria group bacterium]